MPAFLVTSAHQEILQGIHRPVANASDPAITADEYKAAFFRSAAALTAATSVYSTANECSGTGYTAGGEVITPEIVAVTISGKAGGGFTFADISFSGSPLAFGPFRYVMVYRNTGTIKRVLGILDHVTDQVVSGNSYVYAPLADANMKPFMITPV